MKIRSLILTFVGVHLIISFATCVADVPAVMKIEPEVIDRSFVQKSVDPLVHDGKKRSEKIMEKTVENTKKKIVENSVKKAKEKNRAFLYAKLKEMCKVGFLVSGAVIPAVFVSYRCRQEIYGVASSIGSWLAAFLSLKNWLGIRQMRTTLGHHTQQLEDLLSRAGQLENGQQNILESIAAHDERIRNGQEGLRQLIDGNHADIMARLQEIQAKLDQAATKEDVERLAAELEALKGGMRCSFETLAAIEQKFQILLTVLTLKEQVESQQVATQHSIQS